MPFNKTCVKRVFADPDTNVGQEGQCNGQLGYDDVRITSAKFKSIMSSSDSSDSDTSAPDQSPVSRSFPKQAVRTRKLSRLREGEGRTDLERAASALLADIPDSALECWERDVPRGNKSGVTHMLYWIVPATPSVRDSKPRTITVAPSTRARRHNHRHCHWQLVLGRGTCTTTAV